MLKQCETCKKFFGADSDEVKHCAACLQGESTGLGHISDPREQRFFVARNIVYENPDISPEKLVKQMKEQNIEITIKEIMEYVKEGRLTLKNADVNMLCEDCGKRILSGRKCPACTKRFEETIKQTTNIIKEEVIEEIQKKRRMYSKDN